MRHFDAIVDFVLDLGGARLALSILPLLLNAVKSTIRGRTRHETDHSGQSADFGTEARTDTESGCAENIRRGKLVQFTLANPRIIRHEVHEA